MLKEQVQQFIAGNIGPGDRVLAALSGGVDSVVMTHILWILSREMGFALEAAHLNHMLRGEQAQEDQQFSRVFCTERGIPFHTKEVDVAAVARKEKLSCEDAGRQIRYRYFEEIMCGWENAKLALAHNKNDQAETVLLHIIRGSGIEGLKGMVAFREKKVRPLLFATRKEIEAYAADNSLQYRMDKTNQETVYTRNRVRLSLLPMLEKEFNPSVVEQLCSLAQYAKEDGEFLNAQAQTLYQQYVKSDKYALRAPVETVKKWSPSLRKRIWNQMYQTLSGTSLESAHLEGLERLFTKKTGAEISLPKGYIGKVRYEWISIEKKQKKIPEFSYELPENGLIYISEIHTTVQECAADIKNEGIFLPKGHKCVIRNRRSGDTIKINHMTRLVKKLLINLKIPSELRNRLLLVEMDGKIVWMEGIGYADGIKDKRERQIIIMRGDE